MDHDYTAEQQAFDGGLMDLFPLYTGTPGPPPTGSGPTQTNGLVMGYFDGNTVTALWNYAQFFAMNDNSFGTTFGPSTPGVINLGFRTDEWRDRHVERNWRRSERRQRWFADPDRRRRSARRCLFFSDPRASARWAARTLATC